MQAELTCEMTSLQGSGSGTILHTLLTGEDTGVQTAEMTCLSPRLESGAAEDPPVCRTSSLPPTAICPHSTPQLSTARVWSRDKASESWLWLPH